MRADVAPGCDDSDSAGADAAFFSGEPGAADLTRDFAHTADGVPHPSAESRARPAPFDSSHARSFSTGCGLQKNVDGSSGRGIPLTRRVAQAAERSRGGSASDGSEKIGRGCSDRSRETKTAAGLLRFILRPHARSREYARGESIRGCAKSRSSRHDRARPGETGRNPSSKRTDAPSHADPFSERDPEACVRTLSARAIKPERSLAKIGRAAKISQRPTAHSSSG